MTDTKAKLLQSAKELFSEKGYHQTTVDDIVQKAQVSKGAFYFYYKSKEEIMKALVLDMSDRMIGNLEKRVNEGLSVDETLKLCVSEFLEMFYEDRHIAYIFFFELLGTSEEFRRLHFEKTARVRELLLHLVKRGIEKGEIKRVNHEVVVCLLMGFVRFLYLEYIFEDNLTLEEVKAMALEGIEIVLRGLKC